MLRDVLQGGDTKFCEVRSSAMNANQSPTRHSLKGEKCESTNCGGALLSVLFATAAEPALADIVISYNEYSASPTIGRGNGTSTDPNQPGYGAMRIFIQKVMDYTGALPGGQTVMFRPDRGTGRAVNALRAGVQFANQRTQPQAIVSEPSWGCAGAARRARRHAGRLS